MKRHTYAPMETAPRDRPIIAVCGGVEMAVLWQGEPLNCWCYWGDDDDDIDGPVRSAITGWRSLY